MNRRLTAKDRGLLKGAIRRAFARSELHRQAVAKFKVDHYDPNRPRVKKWSYCNACGEVIPTWTTSLDHIDPVIPVDKSFEQMSLDEVVDRTWCGLDNLQILCDTDHNTKTGLETTERKKHKNDRKEM